MDKYLPRIIDKKIDEKMQSTGCIILEGCKWCGKSTSATRHAKHVLRFQNPDEKKNFDLINQTKPSLFLDYEKPLLIDEWQMYPVVWDAIRNDLDLTGHVGDYILTGSSKPEEGLTMHSGTGRMASILMRPMSLFESKESDGKISLSSLFEGEKDIYANSDITFDQIVNAIVRGGWPQAVVHNFDGETADNYFDRLIHEGLKEDGKISCNPERLSLILRSLARNISSPVNTTTIFEDVRANDETIARNTLDKYIELLKEVYILENVPAWNGKIRSKVALRTKEKLQFVDPSIAVSALGISKEDLRKDLNTLGLLFESLVTRDLRIYADELGGKISYYRDETGLESDIIIKLQNGDWGAIEIKLGSGQVEEASKNLLEIEDRIDTKKLGKPKFLMVLTGESSSYRLDNGVYVVSIGNLKP